MSLFTAETVEEVKRLIEFGYDTNLANGKGKSFYLHYACEEGNLDIVKMLCEAGTNVNKQYFGWYPIDTAVEAGYLSIVKYFIENYPNDNLDSVVLRASNKGHTDIIDYLLTLNLELATPGFNWNTEEIFNPLIAACNYGQIDVVDRLLNAGVNTNIVNRYKETAIVAATRKNRLDIVKKLVVFDADYHSYGGKSLIISCENSYDDISEFLINLGCDVNCCINNMTPLICACKNNNLKNSLKVLKLLLERGANPDFVNDYGKKAIDYCTSDEVRDLFIKN